MILSCTFDSAHSKTMRIIENKTRRLFNYFKIFLNELSCISGHFLGYMKWLYINLLPNEALLPSEA